MTLKIKIIISLIILITIISLSIFLYFTLKQNKKLKQEKKSYEKTIDNANKAIQEVCKTHEKINETPNSVGFNNGVDLLHKYAQKKQN